MLTMGGNYGAAMRNTSKPVTVQGVTYSSVKAAAEATGLSRSAIQKASKEGRLNSPCLGVKKRVSSGDRIAEVAVTIRGVTYPSGKIAAEVLGVSTATISMARKRGRLDFVGLGRDGWRD